MRGIWILALAALFASPAAGPAAAGPAAAGQVTLRLWSRADRSGPLRAGNIVSAGKVLNEQLAAEGASVRVSVSVHDSTAKGYDADALDLLKAFAVGKGPDLYVAAHEWIGAFAESGYAWNLEAHIARHPEYYAGVIPILWEACKFKGARYAVPQDTEVRMFFYRKDMLRKIGKPAAFIESLPARVGRGEFTIWDLSRLAKEVVDAGAAKYGLIHRPNVGPDWLMSMASFGFDPFDEKTARLQASRSALTGYLRWIEWNVRNGVTPRNNTSMSWDTVRSLMPSGRAFLFHYGVWDVKAQLKLGLGPGEKAYFEKVGWLHSPPAKKGGAPVNLSHPIVYAVNPRSKRRELAARLVGIATQPRFNNRHAVATGHLPVNRGQAGTPAFREAWVLRAAAPLLARSIFMPNHANIGQFNRIIYKGIQGVETGRLSAEEGAAFVIGELQAEFGEGVKILE